MGEVDDELSTNAAPGSPGAGKGPSVLPVVGPCMSGEGLPYAPEDWPLPGDKWKWRVGSRLAVSGHYHDRFIHPPVRLGRATNYSVKNGWIASKVSVAQFVREAVPGADLDTFFASFEWRIPSPSFNGDKADIKRRISSLSYSKNFNMNGPPDSRTTLKPRECKAGNKTCPPRAQTRNDALQVADCDICCSENGFCRDCCCILCGKTTGSIEEGYGFIRCEAIVSHKCICGHLAHLDCAIHASLAGTVSGSVGLDAEYYCRRCDTKSNIIPHLKRLLDDCTCISSPEHVEKFLDLGLQTLCDSKKTEAQKLLCHIGSLILKLRDGVKLEDLWGSGDTAQTIMEGELANTMMLDTQNGKDEEAHGIVDGPKRKRVDGSRDYGPCKTAEIHSLIEGFISRDDQIVSLELQNKIEQALADLKKSQEFEYLLAEEKLYAQKDLLLGIYRDLDSGRSPLECPTTMPSAANSDTIMASVESRVQQIMQENSKLDDMMQIAKGFGKTPETTLLKYFGAHTNHVT